MTEKYNHATIIVTMCTCPNGEKLTRVLAKRRPHGLEGGKAGELTYTGTIINNKKKEVK